MVNMKRALLVLALLLACMTSMSASVRADEQVKVTVGVFLNHISGIDLKNGQFVVDFYIWFRWEGDALKPSTPSSSRTVASRRRAAS